MKIMFVDSSGNEGWPDPYGKSETNIHVTVGLSMDAKAWLGASVTLTGLLSRAFESYDEKPTEFHHVDIVAGKGAYGQLTNRERKRLTDGIFKIIEEIKPTLFAAVIHKKEHFERYMYITRSGKTRTRALVAPILGPLYLINRFDKYLGRIDDIGLMIMDSEHKTRDKLKQLWTYQVMEDGGIRTPKTRENLHFQQTHYLNIVETCFFTPSELSPGVQLADACCYVTFFKFNRGRGKRFKQIAPYFDQPYGIIEWPPDEADD